MPKEKYMSEKARKNEDTHTSNHTSKLIFKAIAMNKACEKNSLPPANC